MRLGAYYLAGEIVEKWSHPSRAEFYLLVCMHSDGERGGLETKRVSRILDDGRWKLGIQQ